MKKQQKILFAALLLLTMIFSIVMALNESRVQNRRAAALKYAKIIRSNQDATQLKRALRETQAILRNNRPLLKLNFSRAVYSDQACESVLEDAHDIIWSGTSSDIFGSQENEEDYYDLMDEWDAGGCSVEGCAGDSERCA